MNLIGRRTFKVPTSLAWRWHRLRAMGTAEVCFRLGEAVHSLQRRMKSLRDIPLSRTDLGTDAAHLAQELRVTIADRYYPGATSVDTWLTSEQKAVVVAAAEESLAHRVPLMSVVNADLGESIDWLRDPISGRRWPLCYSGKVQFRADDAPGEIRLIWELNRMHHLLPLAIAYRTTGDQRFLSELELQFYSWWKANPQDRGPNWASAMEVAIRIHVWLAILALLCPSPAGPEIIIDLVRAVVRSARHVRRNLSRFSSANNHLIVECSALVAAGTVLSQLPEAHRWTTIGLSILEREVPRQVHSDGVSMEQSTHYHAFVIEALLLVRALPAVQSYAAVPQVLDHYVPKMLDFLMALIVAPEQAHEIGDSDEGRVLPFPADSAYYSELLGAGAYRWRDGRWKQPEQTLPFLGAWLFGADQDYMFDRLCALDPPHVSDFPQGGYTILRSLQNTLAILDYGPLGLSPLAAHGHADALSFALHVNGRPVLDDPGTFCYNTDRPWRDYFRETPAHNTVTVDSHNQSQILGPFLWGRKARTRLVGRDSTPAYECVVAEHDGYAPVLHRRTVLVGRNEGLWVISDYLSGLTGQTVEQFWHLGPGIEPEGHMTMRIPVGNRILWSLFLGDTGDVSLIDTWRSPVFGVRERTRSIRRATVARSSDLTWYTVFSLRPLETGVGPNAFRSGGREYRIQSSGGGLKASPEPTPEMSGADANAK